MDCCLLPIRAGGAEDLAAMAALLTRASPETWSAAFAGDAPANALETWSRLQRAALACAQTLLVEGEGGTLAAMGGWAPMTPWGRVAPSGVAHLVGVVTDAGHRRQGIGRALLRRVTAEARDNGITTLHAHVPRGAAGFLMREGFVEVAQVDLRLAPGVTVPAVHLRHGA